MAHAFPQGQIQQLVKGCQAAGLFQRTQLGMVKGQAEGAGGGLKAYVDQYLAAGKAKI